MRFAEADRYGGFVVGLIVISAGVRVARETAMQLMDTMPDARADRRRSARRRSPCPESAEWRSASRARPGCKYHVDLHLEVDPEMTVRRSHQLAHEVQLRIMETLDWVADVLVHVEPAP